MRHFIVCQLRWAAACMVNFTPETSCSLLLNAYKRGELWVVDKS